MGRLYFFYLGLFISFFGFSQQSKVDSIINLNIPNNIKIVLLKEILSKGKNNSKIKIEEFEYIVKNFINLTNKNDNKLLESNALILLAEKYKQNRNLSNAIKTITKSINLLQYIKNDSLLIKAYSTKAGIYNHHQKYDSASLYFKKAINIGEKSQNLQLLGYAYNGYSSVLSNLGLDAEAIKINQKSLDIAKENNFKQLEIINLNCLGYSMLKVGNYNKSIQYFQDAYKKYDPKIVENKEVLCEIFRFLTINYRRVGNSKLVEKYGQLGLDCYESTGDIMFASDILNTLGTNLLKEKKYREAIPLFQQLIKKSKSINSKIGVNYGKINLSSALININEFDKGEKLLLDILKDTIHPEFLPKKIEKTVYENLADVYELIGHYKGSLKFHRKFKYIEDSLNRVSKLKQITEIDSKYQTEKKEKENLQLKAEKAEQARLLAEENNKKMLLGSGLIAAVIALAIFAFYYRRNQKQKQIIENLQKELHHRIKNNLSVIDGFVDVIKDDFDEERFTEKLTELQSRIDSINEVHLQLYNSEDVTRLDVKKYIDRLSENVSNSFQKPNIQINKAVDNELKLSVDKTFPLGLIINEFLTNSFKYAFGNSSGQITIELKDIGNKYSLHLSDTGKGLPEDIDISQSKSYGLRMITLFIKQLNGTFKTFNDKGLHVTILFPK